MAPSEGFTPGFRGEVRLLVAVEIVVVAVDGLSTPFLRFRDAGVPKGRSSISKALPELADERADPSSLNSSCFTVSFFASWAVLSPL